MAIAAGLRRAHSLSAVVLAVIVMLLWTGTAAQSFDAAPLPGQLLIAAPRIGDPRFYHAVILIVRHDKTGAFGIVINRPLAMRSIKSLLAAAGQPDVDVRGRLRVFDGGPVDPRRGFVVHSTDYHDRDTHRIATGLAITGNRAILRAIGRGRGPKRVLFALGYAGWGAGQLESELDRHDWFMAVGNPRLIFDAPRAGLWREAMGRRTREL